MKDINEKFYTNASMIISEEEARKLSDIVLNLEDASLEELTELI